jgi:hypothetical protein
MSKAVRRSLYGKLAGDVTLTTMLGAPAPSYSQSIYHEQAPKGAGFPYLILQQQAETAAHAFAGGASIYNNELWMVRAVDSGNGSAASADKVDDIDSRVQSLLNDGSLSISGASLMYLRRESGIEYPEVVDGTQYRHRAGLYRLYRQPG